MIFYAVTDYAFSTLTVEKEAYNSAPILYVELKENPKRGTHEVH